MTHSHNRTFKDKVYAEFARMTGGAMAEAGDGDADSLRGGEH